MAKELLVGVVIGATLKAGFSSVFGRAEKTAKALGSEIKAATKANEAFGKSIRAQAALNPTRSLSQQAAAYGRMEVQIRRATQAQDKLNRAIASQRAGFDNRQRLRGEMAETAGHAAAAAGPVIASVKKFMEQENASADLKIAMMRQDGSFGKFAEIDRLTTQWGAALPGNKTDFSKMALGLKSQGISDDTIINGGGLATAQLNVVMDIPIADGSFFAKNMEAHGIKESELLKSADLTQRAYFAAGLKKEDMFEAMKYYAGKANVLGYTGLAHQKKIYAVEGMAATKGIEGSQFGTNFSTFLTNLSKGPENLEYASKGRRGELRRMAESAGANFNFFNADGSVKDLRGITGVLESEFAKIKAKYGEKGVMDLSQAMFGSEGGRIADILIQSGVKGFDEMTAKMDAQASLSDRIKVKTGTLSSALEALGGAAENAAAKFGEAFAPEIKEAAVFTQGFVEESLMPFIQNNKGLIKTVFGLTAGFFVMKLAMLGGAYALSMFAMPFKSLFVAVRKLQAMNQIWKLMQFGRITKGTAFFRMLGLSMGQSAKTAKMFGATFGRMPGIKMFGSTLGSLGRMVLVFGRSLLFTFPGLAFLAAAGVLIYKYWKPVKAFFIGFWDGLKQGLAPLAPVFEGVVSVFSGLWSKIQPFVQPIVDWFNDFFSITKVAEGGARSFGEAVGLWIGEKITAVVDWVSGKVDEIKTAFDGGLSGILTLIINWSPLGAFYAAFAAVMDWFGIELPGKFTEFGGNIIGGLWNGLKAKFEAVKEWFGGIAGWFAGKFQTANQINSPSRLFRRFGGWMMEGLQIGLNAGAPRPLAAVGRITSDLQQRFTNRSNTLSADLSARMRGLSEDMASNRLGSDGGVTVHFSPTINATGGDVGQIQALLARAKEELLRELPRHLKQIRHDEMRRAY